MNNSSQTIAVISDTIQDISSLRYRHASALDEQEYLVDLTRHLHNLTAEEEAEFREFYERSTDLQSYGPEGDAINIQTSKISIPNIPNLENIKLSTYSNIPKYTSLYQIISNKTLY